MIAPTWARRFVGAGCCGIAFLAFVAGLAPAQPLESVDNLLALTWQPAFCEYRPEKPECLQLNGGQMPLASRRLSLHGLWPQPRGKDFCGVSPSDEALDKAGRWSALPEPAVDAATAADLKLAMPGVASRLHRHEWIKHGTCYFAAGGADEYFDDSLYLMDEVNASAVGAFFARHVGKEVATAEIRARFDEAFGAGAGDRVAFICKRDGGRTLIREIRIGLRGIIAPDVPMGDLILAAAPVPSGCSGGFIDPAGLQ